MAIVNQTDIAESLKNCDELASKFCQIINFQGGGFDHDRIIFDRYDGKSLKSNTTSVWNKGADPVYCKVTDSTRVRHHKTILCFSGNKGGGHYLSFRKIDWLFE